MTVQSAVVRCPWAKPDNALLCAYHDEEWGVPLHDDRALFELLSLEGFQAGLSWSTILAKREAFRSAFDRFEPAVVARFDARRIERLMNDTGIVRNRLKIQATVSNARAVLAVVDEFATLDRYVWRFVEGTPIVRRPRASRDIPASSPEAEALSKDLRSRGFRFIGPTVVYAFMQAAGLVDDHLVSCFRSARGA